MYDILIKNGEIIDGTSKRPAYLADVAVKGDKIVDIGRLGNVDSEKTIDAQNYVVSPGFIDIQNHSDSYGALFKDASLESLLHQGITTVLLGQCGSSLAPLLRGSLASIQKWTDITGVNVNWSGFGEFYREFSLHGIGPNIASLVGHATLRRDFVGDENRGLTERENKQIMSLYQRSLKEGAWGISIGLEYSHERAAEEKELLELLKLTAAAGGVASFHLRNEEEDIIAAFEEVLFLVKNSGVKAKISHLKVKGAQNIVLAEQLLSSIEKLKNKDIEIYFDVYPYTVTATVLYLLLPDWASDDGKKELLEKLKNQTLKKEIIKELKAKNYPYDKIKVAESLVDRTIIGKSITALAQNQGISAEEAVLNLILASEDRTIVFIDNLNDEILEKLLVHPLAMIATDGSGWQESDRNSKGITHPRSFGTTAKVLSHYVRERKILNLVDAVYKMSGLPAYFMGLKERGSVEVGNKADIVIFDKNNVRDLATFERPYQYPNGIDFVIVNGKVVIEEGRYNGLKTGEVLNRY